MKQQNIDSIYNEIMLLSDTDRNKLFAKIAKTRFRKQNVIAYTATGKPLTEKEYIKQINIGLNQIENNEVLTDDELQKEIDTW